MDDETWLEEVRRDAGPCPSCGATAARPIVYGMPMSDEYERLEGRVVFAGCIVPEVLHLYSCAACGASYGERTDVDAW